MEPLLGTERSFHWTKVCLVVGAHPVVAWHMDGDMGSLILDGPRLLAGAPWPDHGLGSDLEKPQGLVVGQYDQQPELVVLFQICGFFHRKCQSPLGTDRTGVRWPDASTWMPMGMEYLLPVGISFYTFQSMSYTIDFYRGTLARETHFLRFATYVSFFPQLVAGPIERASSLLPQLAKPRPMRAEAVAEELRSS